tara:strand:+ start:491 stop:871 length:381 start_codon:yes stop_codon:yes gene_type:complete
MILRDEYDIIKLVELAKGLDLSKPHEVTIEPYDPLNTAAQKKLYWKWIGIIGKETGNYKYDQDELLRKEILTPVFYTNNKGRDKEYIKHISELGKKEMSEYMTQVSIMAAEFGINLPHPEDLQRNQ